MPRLIEIDQSKERQITHGKCGAVIGFFSNEVIDGGIYEDYGGGRERYYYIHCPKCGAKIEVRP